MERNPDSLAFVWRWVREGKFDMDILRLMVQTRSKVAMLHDQSLHSAPRLVDPRMLCMNAKKKIAALIVIPMSLIEACSSNVSRFRQAINIARTQTAELSSHLISKPISFLTFSTVILTSTSPTVHHHLLFHPSSSGSLSSLKSAST